IVSSKCCQVESPSPFRFLAALIPPCAHTECERFTGTMENRSTSPPISAILMTAAKPARPPPTTIIFGVAAILYESAIALRCCRSKYSGSTDDTESGKTRTYQLSRWRQALGLAPGIHSQIGGGRF